MIREVIKEAIKLRKVKQKDLAELIGVTKGTMSAFLSGRVNLGQDRIEIILKYLSIDLVIRE